VEIVSYLSIVESFMRTTMLIGMAAILCVADGSGGAGEKKDLPDFIEKPAPEHKILEKLAGVWEASVKLFMEPGKEPNLSKGTMTRKMIMDGRFLKEDYLGEYEGGKFTGLGLYGRLDRAALYLVVLPVWIAILLWSKAWLGRFAMGPAEWLWRTLATGRSQQMRRIDVATKSQ